MRLRLGCVVLQTLILTVLFGCEAAPVPQPDAERDLQQLAAFYGRYMAQHRGATPRDDAEFKAFVEKEGQADLAARGIALDDLFQSSRDKSPYTIRYGINFPPPDPSGGPVVAHESTGVDGKRYVVRTVGKLELVDEKQFAELVK